MYLLYPVFETNLSKNTAFIFIMILIFTSLFGVGLHSRFIKHGNDGEISKRIKNSIFQEPRKNISQFSKNANNVYFFPLKFKLHPNS
jgi:uncharacterized membrane protein SpoIIM required for sporulation